MQTDWALLLPENQYALSTEDDKPYEGKIKGLKTATFPHQLSTLKELKYEAFKTTPHAASYTFDFAKQLIDKEQMGKSAYPDFLTVSISSTDYIGHTFGPNSREMQDAYLRLDVDIANFLKYLDNSVGKGNYLLFLTADHGVAHVPGFLAEHRIPAGTVSDFDLMDLLNKAVENEMDIKKAVSSVQNYQVYLNRNSIKEQGKSAAEVIRICIDELKKKKNIVTAVETAELVKASLPEAQRNMLINGYNPKRSGDIQFIFLPGYFDGGKTGTTHGLWNPYDSHIPLLFYGWKVKQGKLYRETYMTDIAATVAALLQIQMPSACIGKVIPELIK
jgi:hypothetical protein